MINLIPEPTAKETMNFNTTFFKTTGATLALVIIAVCSVIIFKATNGTTIDPASFSGKATIVSLESDVSQSWARACKATVRDEKKREMTVNTRSDVCGTRKAGDEVTMDSGLLILEPAPAHNGKG